MLSLSLALKGHAVKMQGCRMLQVPCAVLALCVNCLVGSPLFAQEVSAVHLLEASRANADRIVSGRGILKTNMRGTYFGCDGETVKTSERSLFFAGDKARIEEALSNGNRRVSVFDGMRLFQTGPFGGRSNKTSVRVRTLDMEGQTVYTGYRFDLKGFMEPMHFSIDDLLTAFQLDHTALNLSATREPDGLYRVSVSKKSDTSQEFLLWIDPDKGYAITSDQQFYKGALLDEVHREFAEHDGAYVVTACERVRYVMGSEDVAGVFRMQFDDYELNVNVDPHLFTVAGLGVGPDSNVTDKDTGLRYTLDPLAGVEDSIDKLLDSGALENEPDAGDAPGGNEALETVATERDIDGVSTGEGPDRSKRKGWVLWLSAIAACLVAVIASLVVMSRRKKKAAST